MDHIGALPYFTEVCGYKGPIYMTVIFSFVLGILIETNEVIIRVQTLCKTRKEFTGYVVLFKVNEPGVFFRTMLMRGMLLRRYL